MLSHSPYWIFWEEYVLEAIITLKQMPDRHQQALCWLSKKIEPFTGYSLLHIAVPHDGKEPRAKWEVTGGQIFSARVNIFEMPETRNIATCCLFSNGLELLIDERGLTWSQSCSLTTKVHSTLHFCAPGSNGAGHFQSCYLHVSSYKSSVTQDGPKWSEPHVSFSVTL